MSGLRKGGNLVDVSGRAPQACQPCRKLKRKCTKELPACSLCIRLEKDCGYEATSESSSPSDRQRLVDRIQTLEMLLKRADGRASHRQTGSDTDPGLEATAADLSAIPTDYNTHFPSSLYFLDSDSFAKLSSSVLDPGMHVPAPVLHLLGSQNELMTMCSAFFSTVSNWFPIISKKRLLPRAESLKTESDASTALLLLCMKLATQLLSETEDARSLLYWTCRQFFARIENTPLLSLALLQAKLLIALYEIGHGIYPAGYLSIGHAARLGHIMGLQDRKNAPQLFRAAPTLTGREEERRTWWAVVVLDRIVNLGMYGGSLATGEPLNNELLPCNDDLWEQGAISGNGLVFGPNLESTDVGRYAQICQAAHVLGRVQRHCADHQLDTSFRLREAMQLDRALLALDATIQKTTTPPQMHYSDDAIAICCSARFLLYELYACNESGDNFMFPTGDEADMQKLALAGLEQCVERMYHVALRVCRDLSVSFHPGSMLVTHALYWAAAECRWYIKEGKQEAVIVSETILDALKILNRRWRRAGDYIRLLEREEMLSE